MEREKEEEEEPLNEDRSNVVVVVVVVVDDDDVTRGRNDEILIEMESFFLHCNVFSFCYVVVVVLNQNKNIYFTRLALLVQVQVSNYEGATF